jgi:hypothetical protein
VATLQKSAIHAPPFIIYTDSVHSFIQNKNENLFFSYFKHELHFYLVFYFRVFKILNIFIQLQMEG